MKGPSVPLVSSQVTPAVPIPSPSKAQQDADNIKKGPLWAARGSADTLRNGIGYK